MRRWLPSGARMPVLAACVAIGCLVQGCSRPMVFRGKETKAVEIRYGRG